MSGEKLPYMPLFVFDLLTDEFYQRLTYPQRGLYLDLLMLQWINGSVPSNARAVLEQLRVSEERDRLGLPDVEAVLAKFAVVDEGRAQNPRLLAIRTELEAKKSKRIKAGRIGGHQTQSNARAVLEHCSSIQNQNQNQNHKKKEVAPTPSASDLPESLRSAHSAIVDWLEYKHEKRQTYRPKGMAALITRFESWGPDRTTAAISYSMAMNYTGAYEHDKKENQHGRETGERLSKIEAPPGKYEGIGIVVGDTPRHEVDENQAADLAEG